MRFERFEKILNDSTSKYNKIKKEDYNSIGEFPIIDQGQNFIGGFTDDKSLITSWSQPVIVFGDHTKIFKYIDFPFAIGADGVKVLTLKDPSFNAKYYYFFLRSLKLTDAGYSRHYKFLKESKLPLPLNLSDQLHIANLLTRAETLISQRKQSIALLDEFLKSTFLEMFGDPDKNEKGFQFVELEELCSVIVDCPHSTPLKSNEKTNFPCIRTSELTNGYISWDSMQYLEESEYKSRTQRLVPEEGDIVYGREGTYGDAIRIPSTHRFSLGQRTMLFRPNYEKTNSIFLWAMVRSDFVYRQAKKKNSGSTVGHVNVKDIKQFKILNPPIELQTRFAQIVEKAEALKSQFQSSLRELENLYGSLSQRAFRGEFILNKAEEVLMAAEPEEGYPK